MTTLPATDKVIHNGSFQDEARDVFDRVGWDPARFNVYRCVVEYPVVPSSVTLEFDLPEGD